MTGPTHEFLSAFLGTGGAPAAPTMPSFAPTMPTAPADPALSMPAPSSRQTVQPRTTDSTGPTSPAAARRRYLQDQSARILTKGGSTADVGRFLEQEGVRLPPNLHFAASASTVETPGYAKGLSMAAVDGATFGWGDEAIGSIVGLATGEGVSKGIDDYRQSLAAFRHEHPVAAGAATLAGGIAGAMALPEFGAARLLGAGAGELGTLGRIGASALEGAGAGAIAGAGGAEGSLSDRARGAIIGGTVGAVLAGGGTGIVKTMGAGVGGPAVAGAIIGTSAGLPGAMAGMIGGALAGKASQKVLQTVGATIERTTAKDPAALWARVVSAMDPTNGSMALQARTALRRAFDADGISMDAASAEADRLSGHGVPVSVIDLGGDNVQALFGEAARVRSPETQELVRKLLERQAGQGDRLVASLFDRLRLGVANAYTAGEALVAKRHAESAPLYDAATQQTVQVTPDIRRVLNNPTFRSMYDEGRAIALAEDHAGLNRGLSVPPLQIVQEGPGGLRYVVDAQGQAQMAPAGLNVGDIANASLPIRGIDYMKRGLDQLRQQSGTLGAGPGSKPILDRQLGTALGAQLGKLLDHVGDQVPVYGQARAAFKGPSALLDAMALGKGGRVPFPTAGETVGAGMEGSGVPRFTERTGEEVARQIKKLPPDQRAAFRIGALQDIADLMASSTAKTEHTADAVFGQPAMERRIRALFDDPHGPEASQYFDAVKGEATVTSRSTKIAERPAPARSEQMQQAEGPTMPSGIGFKFAVVGTAIRQIVKSSRQQFTEKLSNELSALGTRGINGTAELQAVLDALRYIPTGHAQLPGIVAGNMATRVKL